MEKGTGKYHIDNGLYTLKSFFNPQTQRGFVGYSLVLPAMIGGVIFNEVAPDKNALDPFPLNEAVVEAEYRQSIENRLTEVKTLKAELLDLDRKVHMQTYDTEDVSDALKIEIDKKKLAYDYARKNIMENMLMDEFIPEGVLKQVASDVAIADVKYLNNTNYDVDLGQYVDTKFHKRDECVVSFKENAVKSTAEKPEAYGTVSACMNDTSNEPFSPGGAWLLSLLLAILSSGALTFIGCVMCSEGVGRNWKSKPKRQDYIKKGN